MILEFETISNQCGPALEGNGLEIGHQPQRRYDTASFDAVFDKGMLNQGRICYRTRPSSVERVDEIVQPDQGFFEECLFALVVSLPTDEEDQHRAVEMVEGV